MRILALDTSTEWCSVATGAPGRWHCREEHTGQGHAERALVLVEAALADAGAALADVDGIAFGAGPGSFTGIRIACALAQGLALGADRPVVAVPTLSALAQACWTERRMHRIVACLDARMREVYVAALERGEAGWVAVDGPRVVRPGDVVAPPGEGWYGAGNGFAAYPGLADQLRLAGVDAGTRPNARAVGELAAPRFAAGEGVAAADALPVYVRHRVALTTAERDAGVRL